MQQHINYDIIHIPTTCSPPLSLDILFLLCSGCGFTGAHRALSADEASANGRIGPLVHNEQGTAKRDLVAIDRSFLMSMVVPGVKSVRSESFNCPPEISDVREDGPDDVLAEAVPVGEELRDGRLEPVDVELPPRILVRPPVALRVRVVPQAAA